MTAKPKSMVPVSMLACICQRCGHHWLPKDPDHKPIKCPFCSCKGWDRPYSYKTYRGREHSLKVLQEEVSDETRS